MQGLGIDTFLSLLIPLSLYFLITLSGAFLKDAINTIKKTDTKFRLSRILIGAIFGAFIMLGLEGMLLKKFTLNQVVTLAFIMGTVSFELFDRLSKLDNMIKFLKAFKEFKEQYKIPDVGSDNEENKK